MKRKRMALLALMATSSIISCAGNTVDTKDPGDNNSGESGNGGSGESGGSDDNKPGDGGNGGGAVSTGPNLVYIFPDQHRLTALSIWRNPKFAEILATAGDPVETPNIDRIFEEGLIFSQATSTFPLSSPQRAMLMSGMFPTSNGVTSNCHISRPGVGLHEDIECFTDVLASSGYSTAYVGKTHWHETRALFDSDGIYVGKEETPGGHTVNVYDTYIPEGKSRHSNEFWYQHVKDKHYSAWAYSNQEELVDGKPDGIPYITSRFSATSEADAVLKFLDNKDGERDSAKPFSIFWALNPPHPPYNSMNDCDEILFNKCFKHMPYDELFVRENVPENSQFELNARIYFTLVQSIDKEIGRILDKLDQMGVTDNTMIIFTSDHGEMMGSQDKNGKNVVYDESFIVPFAIKYPGKLQNRAEDLLLTSVDIMPTVLGLLGLKSEIPSSVQGVDFSDGLISGTFADGVKPITAPMLCENNKGVRSNKYTYHVENTGKYRIFNNIEDPYQLKELTFSDIPAEDVKMLQRELGRWLTVAKDPWATSKKCSDIIIY